jgi:trk system potassium uptake protein TrkA
MAIAATEDDEYNIVKCLEAKEHGIGKVLAINNELEYYNVMHALGIVVVRGPKINAFNAIVERINSSKIVTERKYCGGKAEIYLRKIFRGSHLVGSKIKPMKKPDRRVLYLIREDSIHPFDEVMQVQENDIIALFTTQDFASEAREWIYGL